jgi:hypothetical protein
MKTPDTNESVPSAPNKRNFKLSHRQSRVCQVLATGRKLWREEVDRIAGASNGPELMRQLRRKGLEWQCDRIKKTDRDGNKCKPGLYSIVGSGWETLQVWGFLNG